MGQITRRHLLAGGASIFASRALGAEKESVGMQLILAADVSCSVNTERYAVQQQGYVRALQDSRVMQAIRANTSGRPSLPRGWKCTIEIMWSEAPAMSWSSQQALKTLSKRSCRSSF